MNVSSKPFQRGAKAFFLEDMVCLSRHRSLALDVRVSADSVAAMNTRDALIAALGLCAMFAWAAPALAEPQEMSGSIQDMMTPGEFKAAGLSKLSPAELEKLNAWLQGYHDVTEKTAAKKATAVASRTKLDLLVSRVDGQFNGLTGRTIIRLEDGTVWKQANADDRFRPRVTDRPAAVVIHGIFGYKMQVEGTQEFYVDPVRPR